MNFQIRINKSGSCIFSDSFYSMILSESCVMGHEVLMIEMFTNLITVAIFPLFVAFGLKPKQSVQSLSESGYILPGKGNCIMKQSENVLHHVCSDNFLVWCLCYS